MAEQEAPPPIDYQRLSGYAGVDIFFTGDDLSAGPQPALFYFALSGEESLATHPYNLPVTFLQGVPIRIFSISLPGHGDGFDNAKAIPFWADSLRQGRRTLEDFITLAAQQVDYLIDGGYIDPAHVAVAGLSRGGFIAAHLAARDPRIKTLLAFAPLTKLARQQDFSDVKDSPFLEKLEPCHLSDSLANKHSRIYIGNRDTRIGTDACFEFFYGIVEAAFKQGIRSPQAELFITPSIGHQGHGTPVHIFKEGAEWIKSRLTTTDS